MKTNATKQRYIPKTLLVVTLAAAASAVACSGSKPSHAVPAAAEVITPSPTLQTVAASRPIPAMINEAKLLPPRPKPPASKLLTYRSRDYGISFDYPWQYAYIAGKAIGRDGSPEQVSSGNTDRLPLVRVEVPKGFYPDTDFESGSLTLSLNQNVDEAACYSTLAASKGAEPQAKTINSVPFRWTETEEGGHGKAIKQRTYLAFANDTCYQLVAVVNTNNEGALAREIDPDQVLRRLDAIVQTVKISGAASPATSEPVVSIPATTAASQD